MRDSLTKMPRKLKRKASWLTPADASMPHGRISQGELAARGPLMIEHREPYKPGDGLAKPSTLKL